MSRNDNVFPFDATPSSEDSASRWIARIDAGPLTPEERQELKDWLAADPAHARLLDAQAMLWSQASRAKFPPTGAPQRAEAARRRPALLPAGLGLAGVALVAVLAGTVLRGPEQVPPAHYATDIGKRADLPLSDGSVLHLNTASSGTVAYSRERRLIILERGEGYFEVAKDKVRPFDVVAGDTIVRAVGTKFSVRRLDGGRLEVHVMEGVVELLPKGAKDELPREGGFSKPVRLARGQSGLQAGPSLYVTQGDEKRLEDKLSWLHGRLSFDNESLAEVVAQMNRYSGTRIVIADPTLRELRVSGAFNVGEGQVLLNSLEQGFGLRVEQADGVVRITRKTP